VTTLLFEPDGRYYVGYGFGRAGVVPIMPISPSACLLAGVAGSVHRFVRDEDVWEINKALISCSLRFTYSRKRSEHVDSLVQQFASSIRYGIEAFKGTETDDLFDLLS
jgi:hypothetical protein